MLKWITPVIFALIATSSFAAEEATFDCGIKSEHESTRFKPIQQSATALGKRLCQDLLVFKATQAELNTDKNLAEFGNLVATEMQTRFGEYFDASKLKAQTDFFQEKISAVRIQAYSLPDLEASYDMPNAELHFSGSRAAEYLTTAEGDCQARFNAGCSLVFDDFAKSIAPYKTAYRAVTANEASRKLNALTLEWDRFLSDARPMNTAGLLVTSLMERDHLEQDYLVGPPHRQWIALQPTLVYEYMNDAADGEQQKATIGIEWLGVNYWDKKVPIGVSVMSVYADRASAPDVGTGINIVLYNTYSIGYMWHGDLGAIYVSVDVMKLFQNKDKLLEDFKAKMKP
ncbi:MAG: hypothetical protein ACFHX7_12405 [Pseudomonadota bacterium]